MNIRSEAPGDAQAIEAVTAAAFLHAPHTSHTEHFIVRRLRERGALAISLVAEDGGAVVGHVALSPVTISDGSLAWYGLGPISVVPECQGRGIGSALVAQALAELRKQRAAGCVLLGDPNFYARFGFKPQPGLQLPGVPAEYFQALAFTGAIPAGTVAFDEAFDAVS